MPACAAISHCGRRLTRYWQRRGSQGRAPCSKTVLVPVPKARQPVSSTACTRQDVRPHLGHANLPFRAELHPPTAADAPIGCFSRTSSGIVTFATPNLLPVLVLSLRAPQTPMYSLSART
jgi:hypothetical protein